MYVLWGPKFVAKGIALAAAVLNLVDVIWMLPFLVTSAGGGRSVDLAPKKTGDFGDS